MQRRSARDSNSAPMTSATSEPIRTTARDGSTPCAHSGSIEENNGTEARRKAGLFLRHDRIACGLARIEQHADGRGAEDERPARQRRGAGLLAVHEPRPDRIEHRLDKKEEPQ